MQLAVVRVADGDAAQHVPFQQKGETLQVALPGDRPSQIGFFIGQAGSRLLAAGARIGAYSGEAGSRNPNTHSNTDTLSTEEAGGRCGGRGLGAISILCD